MSPLWRLKYVCASTSGRISVLAAAVLLVGASEIDSPAWAKRDKPPVAVKDLAVTEAGTEVRINALANDYDPDGTKVRLKRVKKPSKGKIRKTKNGTIRYTPDEAAEGKDRFRYVIKDRNGKGKKAKGKVVVNILANSGPGGGGDNDPPVADAGPNQSVTVGQSITLDGSNSFDPNGDPLTYGWSLVSWPAGGTADFSDSTKKKPTFVADVAGTFIAELVVYDGIIRSSADRVEIAVRANSTSPLPPFAELCAEPGVVYCQGFDVDTAEADFNNGALSPTRPYGIAVDNEVYADGGGSLRLTVDGSRRQEVTGTIGYDFPQMTSGTFYVGLKMRFGDGLQTLLRSQGFNHSAAGMKFFQIVAGSRSCSSEEIVFYDNASSAWLTGVPGLVYSCSGWPVHAPNGDYQPIDGSNKEPCKWRTVDAIRDAGTGMVGWEPCRVFEDDTWHQVELEVRIGDGYRLWLDGNLTIDTQVRPPAGPYGRFYMSNYMTGYFDPIMAGSHTYGDGLWRIYYDNLIISRNCIANCGQAGS